MGLFVIHLPGALVDPSVLQFLRNLLLFGGKRLHNFLTFYLSRTHFIQKCGLIHWYCLSLIFHIFLFLWLLFNFWRTSPYYVFQSLWTILKFYFGNLSIFFASLVYSLTCPLLFIWMQCLLHFSEHALEFFFVFVFAFHSFFFTFIICVLG